jgi:hypothetical protein
MSTKLHDLANQALLGATLVPQTITASANGTSIDCITADGSCFAIQLIGAVSGTSPTLAGKLQESSDGSTWTDISGAVFTTVTASTNTQIITFERTKRYLRHVATVGGTSPSFAVAALIGEQKKSV